MMSVCKYLHAKEWWMPRAKVNLDATSVLGVNRQKRSLRRFGHPCLVWMPPGQIDNFRGFHVKKCRRAKMVVKSIWVPHLVDAAPPAPLCMPLFHVYVYVYNLSGLLVTLVTVNLLCCLTEIMYVSVDKLFTLLFF